MGNKFSLGGWGVFTWWVYERKEILSDTAFWGAEMQYRLLKLGSTSDFLSSVKMWGLKASMDSTTAWNFPHHLLESWSEFWLTYFQPTPLMHLGRQQLITHILWSLQPAWKSKMEFQSSGIGLALGSEPMDGWFSILPLSQSASFSLPTFHHFSFHLNKPVKKVSNGEPASEAQSTTDALL